ncbi:MAG: hypothetical protein GX493_02205 [Firmicutes bacterium]|nr:hypothetical protein [Bacillota bacterium]
MPPGLNPCGMWEGPIFHLNAGLLLDLGWPKLNWTHPQQAMKGNLNVLAAIFIAAGTWSAWGSWLLVC